MDHDVVEDEDEGRTEKDQDDAGVDDGFVGRVPRFKLCCRKNVNGELQVNAGKRER